MSLKKFHAGDTVYILKGLALRTENVAEGKVVSVSEKETVVSSEGHTYTFVCSIVIDPETSQKETALLCGSEQGIVRCFHSLDEIRKMKRKCLEREQNLLNTLRKQNGGIAYANNSYTFVKK